MTTPPPPTDTRPIVVILANDRNQVAMQTDLPAEKLLWLFQSLSQQLLAGVVKQERGAGLIVPTNGSVGGVRP